MTFDPFFLFISLLTSLDTAPNYQSFSIIFKGLGRFLSLILKLGTIKADASHDASARFHFINN